MDGMRLPPRTGQTLTGMVKSYNRKGFGFIMCQAIDQDIYFSRESLHPQLQTSDLAGENVTFEVHRFPDGKLQARNLRAVGDVSDFRGNTYSGSRRPPPPPPRLNTPMRGSREEEDRSRDWYCESCGERNFVKRSECFKCKSLRPRGDGSPVAMPGPPRRTLSPHAGSRAMREMLRAQLGGGGGGGGGRKSRSRSRKKRGGKRRSRSRKRKSSGSSSSSGRSRKKGRGKSRSKRGKSSGSSSSSSSSPAKSDSDEPELVDGEKAKAEVQAKLTKLREILELPESATLADVTKRYRQLALRYHPDKHQGEAKEEASRRFVELQAAYEAVRKHLQSAAAG